MKSSTFKESDCSNARLLIVLPVLRETATPSVEKQTVFNKLLTVMNAELSYLKA